MNSKINNISDKRSGRKPAAAAKERKVLHPDNKTKNHKFWHTHQRTKPLKSCTHSITINLVLPGRRERGEIQYRNNISYCPNSIYNRREWLVKGPSDRLSNWLTDLINNRQQTDILPDRLSPTPWPEWVASWVGLKSWFMRALARRDYKSEEVWTRETQDKQIKTVTWKKKQVYGGKIDQKNEKMCSYNLILFYIWFSFVRLFSVN